MGHSVKIEPCEFLSAQNILSSVNQFRGYFSVTYQNNTSRRQRTGCPQETFKGIKLAGMELGLKEQAEFQSLCWRTALWSSEDVFAKQQAGWVNCCCFLMQDLKSGSCAFPRAPAGSCWLWHLSSALPVPPFPSARTKPQHSSPGEPAGTKTPLHSS